MNLKEQRIQTMPLENAGECMIYGDKNEYHTSLGFPLLAAVSRMPILACINAAFVPEDYENAILHVQNQYGSTKY